MTAPSPPARDGDPRPNVLLITVDQWRGDCLSRLGHPMVRTPWLDSLAARGVAFARHFAQSAPCGPSRASLYTGMYAMNHRSVLNGTPLDARHTNLALEARALGYDPVLYGYTDTSLDPRTLPGEDPRLREYESVLPGFDGAGHLPESNPRAWLEHLRDVGYPVDPDGDWRPFVDRPAAGYPGSDRWGEHRAPTQYAAEHSQTAFLTTGAIGEIDRRRGQGKAWFLHVSYLRPHPPFFAPEPYNTMYDPQQVPPRTRAATADDEGSQHPLLGLLVSHPYLAAPTDDDHLAQLVATYFGMQSEVDDQIGRLLAHLDATGEAERTIVVVGSDHGEQLGDHYLLHKLGYFDESYHVPLIVTDPRPGFDAARGRIVEAFTENVDVMPTLLDLLGGEIPLQCDGRSLRAWLEGATPDDWRDAAHWEFDFRDPDGQFFEQAFGLTIEECSLAVLRDGAGKYVQFAGHHAFPPVFFDLTDDPGQLRNRAADPEYAPRVLEYAQRMLSWRMRHADRTLSGTKLTKHAGPVSARAPRVR